LCEHHGSARAARAGQGQLSRLAPSFSGFVEAPEALLELCVTGEDAHRSFPSAECAAPSARDEGLKVSEPFAHVPQRSTRLSDHERELRLVLPVVRLQCAPVSSGSGVTEGCGGDRLDVAPLDRSDALGTCLPCDHPRDPRMQVRGDAEPTLSGQG
jgi:hypothetical protein